MLSYWTCHLKTVKVIANDRTTTMGGSLLFIMFFNITLMVGAFWIIVIDNFESD